MARDDRKALFQQLIELRRRERNIEGASKLSADEHARCGGFPVDSVVEIAAVIGPDTAG